MVGSRDLPFWSLFHVGKTERWPVHFPCILNLRMSVCTASRSSQSGCGPAEPVSIIAGWGRGVKGDGARRQGNRKVVPGALPRMSSRAKRGNLRSWDWGELNMSGPFSGVDPAFRGYGLPALSSGVTRVHDVGEVLCVRRPWLPAPPTPAGSESSAGSVSDHRLGGSLRCATCPGRRKEEPAL